MKKRRLFTLIGSVCLIIVLAALLLPGCAKEVAPAPAAPAPTPAKPTPAPTPAPAPEGYKMPDMIRWVAGGSTTGMAFAVSTGLQRPMEKAFGTQIRVLPTIVVAKRPRIIFAGDAEVWLDNWGNATAAAEFSHASAGDPPGPIRVFWPGLVVQDYTAFVRGDSDIQSVYDIKGKRVVLGVHSATFQQFANGLVAFAGLTNDDVTWVQRSGTDACAKAVVMGQADISMHDPADALGYEIAGCPQGIRWLDMPQTDKEGWARFIEQFPTVFPHAVVEGVEGAIGKTGYGATKVIYCRADLDDEFAYNLAWFLGERYDDYKDWHPKLSHSTHELQKSIMGSFALPFHPGAIKYFKEVGIWTDEADKRQQYWLGLEEQYLKAWDKAKAEAVAKGIKISAMNEDWLKLAAEAKTGLDHFDMGPIE